MLMDRGRRMRVDIVTIFPEAFAPLDLSLLRRARERGLLEVVVWDLREFTTDRHRQVRLALWRRGRYGDEARAFLCCRGSDPGRGTRDVPPRRSHVPAGGAPDPCRRAAAGRRAPPRSPVRALRGDR